MLSAPLHSSLLETWSPARHWDGAVMETMPPACRAAVRTEGQNVGDSSQQGAHLSLCTE